MGQLFWRLVLLNLSDGWLNVFGDSNGEMIFDFKSVIVCSQSGSLAVFGRMSRIGDPYRYQK